MSLYVGFIDLGLVAGVDGDFDCLSDLLFVACDCGR